LLYVQNIAVIVVFVALFLGAQYFFSDRVVLAASGAHIVSEDEAPELHSAIERLCAMADLPKPKVAIATSPVPNAFATGRNQNHAVVAVTSSLLQRLEEPEVEAVLAHELSHVKNRDMLVMTIASFVTTIAGFLMRYWFFIGAGGNRRDNNIFLFFIALAAIWIISFLITRALSRYREFAADRGSAIITAHPANLASALLKISGYIERVPTEDIRKVEGISQFFIIPAISRGSALNLLSTHPPIEKRIERLRQMEAQLAGQSA
jgi:heat shock protein HtpX